MFGLNSSASSVTAIVVYSRPWHLTVEVFFYVGSKRSGAVQCTDEYYSYISTCQKGALFQVISKPINHNDIFCVNTSYSMTKVFSTK